MLRVADALGALVGYLTSATGVPFSTETPSTVPTRYGRIQHLNGTRDSLILDSQATHVRVWGETAQAAWGIANTAFAALLQAEGQVIDGVLFLAVDCDLPAWFPDPETRGPSYLFTATLLTEAVET